MKKWQLKIKKEDFGTPKRIRTAVAGVKGQCPRPLDDGGTGISISKVAVVFNISPASFISRFHRYYRKALDTNLFMDVIIG
jgi:hypothetical protein